MDQQIEIPTTRTAFNVRDLEYLANEYVKTFPNGQAAPMLTDFFNMVAEKIGDTAKRVKDVEVKPLIVHNPDEAPVVGAYLGGGNASMDTLFDVNSYEDYILFGKMRVCAHCLGSLMKNSHSLSKVVVGALDYFPKRSTEFIHRKDLYGLASPSVFGNFGKMVYWGLIAPKDPFKRTGFWRITSRGLDFIAGRIAIPKQIKTFRNYITDLDDECISISEIEVVVETHDDFAQNMEPTTEDDRDMAAGRKMDDMDGDHPTL